MSDQTYQSTIDWKASSGQQIRPTRIKTAYPISTITHTDYITSTIIAQPAVSTEPNVFEPANYAEDLWEHRIHRFLPVILAFAIIGILTVLGSLIYLAYRFYQANRSSRRRRRRRDAEETLNFEDENNKKSGSPISTTLSNIIPWLAIPSPNQYTNHQPQQREPIRYEKSDLNRIMLADSHSSTRRPSLAPSWLAKILPNKFSNTSRSTPRHMSLPTLRPTIDNLNVPISSTFKPIDKSFLTLVPRSEIWLDPNRRRGVDELDIWERKKSGTIVAPEEVQPAPLMWRFPSASAYPDSPDSAERRFSAGASNRRSIHIESRRSSTTTMQEILPPHHKKPANCRSKSESTRYDEDDDPNNTSTIASTSFSYPNALSYHQEEEDQEDEHFSKFAITVKLPKSQLQKQAESSASDVRLARQALEISCMKNSSSQWLHFSGSKSF